MEENNEIELFDLVGKHVLDAVDFSNEQVKDWDYRYIDCQVIRFRLDGKCYTATEDPYDGYRSHMGSLKVSEDASMENVFPAVGVIGRYRTKGSYSQVDDVLELVDANTGEVIVEVGTENTDDYYPYFVSSFHPEAMVINKDK